MHDICTHLFAALKSESKIMIISHYLKSIYIWNNAATIETTQAERNNILLLNLAYTECIKADFQ